MWATWGGWFVRYGGNWLTLSEDRRCLGVEYACHPGVGLGGNGESQQGKGDRAHGEKYSFAIDPDVDHPPHPSFEKTYYSGGI